MKPNNTELPKVFSSFFEKILSSLEDSPTKGKISKKWSIFSTLLNSSMDEKVLNDYIESMDDVSKELYFLQICQSSLPLISDNTRSTFFTNEEPRRIEPIYESQYEDNWYHEDSFILNRDRIMSNEEQRFNHFKAPINSRYNYRPRGNTSDRLDIKNPANDRFSITRLSYDEPINQKFVQPKKSPKRISVDFQPEKIQMRDILNECTNFVSEFSRNTDTLKELHQTLSTKVPEKKIYKKAVKSRQDAHNQYVNQMMEYYLSQQQNQIQMGNPNMQMMNQYQGQNPYMVGNQNTMNAYNNQMVFQNHTRMM